MNDKQMARLLRMKNRSTAYEIAIENTKDGRKFLVCYSASKSRASILRALCKRGEMLQGITGRNAVEFGKRACDPLTMGEWIIYPTGRTEYEIVAGGLIELTYIQQALQEMKTA